MRPTRFRPMTLLVTTYLAVLSGAQLTMILSGYKDWRFIFLAVVVAYLSLVLARLIDDNLFKDEQD